MTRTTLLLALWTLLAGAGIPLIGVLNNGVARSVGSPITATAVMFGAALLVAATLALLVGGVPTLAQLAATPPWSYGAGLPIGFYALSATIIISRFGTGNFVAFILIAQLATAAVINQFGLFGMAQRPNDAVRLAGFGMILVGTMLTQLVSRPTNRSSTRTGARTRCPAADAERSIGRRTTPLAEVRRVLVEADLLRRDNNRHLGRISTAPLRLRVRPNDYRRLQHFQRSEEMGLPSRQSAKKQSCDPPRLGGGS